MICLVKEIPKLSLPLAEVVKINCNYNSYRDVALFWLQNDSQAVISMLDGNMVVYNKHADIEELREFISVISPQSVFSDTETMKALFGEDFHKVYVMKSEGSFSCDCNSHTLNSSEIYKLLDVNGLEMPPYEHFAVDFCHRLNGGTLKYFAIKDLCAAVGISDGNAALVNGIASHKKGMGRVALCGLLSQYNITSLAVCEKQIMPFYLKNKFSLDYTAGYWRKNP